MKTAEHMKESMQSWIRIFHSALVRTDPDNYIYAYREGKYQAAQLIYSDIFGGKYNPKED